MELCDDNNNKLMKAPELEMSMEQMPVLMDKTQMSGDRARSQCGLTSLLPMSCRGRAAAFARDLHSRLRNLGAAQEDDCESSWLARDSQNPPATSSQRDLDTFYDFELECESPSSPVDECEPPFLPERSPSDDQEPHFYDVDSEPEAKEQTKLMLQQPEKRNGFRFSTAFYADSSPVKLQPAPRENGHVDKKLFSPITFEGCAKQNSSDEVDCVARPSSISDLDRLSFPIQNSVTIDSDSEFESAKSDPSEFVDDVHEIGKKTNGNDSKKEADNEVTQREDITEATENDITEAVENLSLSEVETLIDDEVEKVSEVAKIESGEVEICEEAKEVVTSEVPVIKESSPIFEIDISGDQQDHDEDFDRPQRVRRCSSLKTGKTPPGTPGRKKIVRFADVLGLDLADVKTFMDEIPVIPKSAYDDLTGCDFQSSPPVRGGQQRLGGLTLVPLFQLPQDCSDKLEKYNACLETARVCDGVHVTVCGSVRVRNLDFHKTVHIRYTMNRWKTFTDLQTTYVAGSCDGYSDRFQFVLYVPCISSGQRLEMAVRFQCKGQQFWDNNCGANYCFDCLALGVAASTPHTGALHPTVDWHPSFY